MSDWSDSEQTVISKAPAAKKQESSGQNNDDDEWGNKFENIQISDDHNDGGSRGGRGRGRGRGRGGFGRSDNRERREDNDNSERSGFAPRGGGRGFHSNNDERPRRNFGDGEDRPPRRNFGDSEGGGFQRRERNDNFGNENKVDEEKPREIYVPPTPTEDEDEMFATGISAGINFDKFEDVEVKLTGEGLEGFKPIESFQEANFRELIQANVDRCGYKKPTPIQKYAIPIIGMKRDLMGCAQTGSGKTAAFTLPIINGLLNDNETTKPGKPKCLIVAPTRELVIQIFEEARKFALHSYIKVQRIYGGTQARFQSEYMTSDITHILVATPGRLIDFLDRGHVSLEDLRYLVLDEADRMLDMGFRETIKKLYGYESLKKDNLSTLMFSATFAEPIQELAATYLRDYLFLAVGIIGGASTDVEQEFIEVARNNKREKLSEILDQYCNCAEEDRILVFVDTKKTADFLASFMSETKISTTSITGDRLQREREQALRDFRAGKHKVLIATNVAARGLDIKGVTHVINYDLPKEIDDYVHRIGRTGRVGNRGKSTSFYDPERDAAVGPELVRILSQAKQSIPDFLSHYGAGYGSSDQFGGTDIRASAPMKPAQPQAEEEEW